MSSVQHLREFISARLTAAAEEIFSEFEKTIVQYEEEIDRQRSLLSITWKPQIKLHRTDVPQQHACKEAEAPAEQQLCEQERTSSLNQEEPEPPQIKEELEELCTNQEREQLVLKQDTDAFILTHKNQDFSEAETNTGQFLYHNSLFTKSLNQKDGNHMDMGSAGDAGVKPKQRHDENIKQCDSESVKTSVKCDVCGKAFSDRSSMEQHRAAHRGVKPFVCKTCGKCFSHSRTLHTHQRIHTGDKLFSCKTCGKAFTRRSCLLTHMRSHSGEKPFSCGICGTRFNQKSHLTVHAKFHTSAVYSCDRCGKSFCFKKDLTAHNTTHI